jgi:hypothetical protein
LQRIQKLGGMVGAIVGDHKDFIETQHAIPGNPFNDERPFVSHRGNNRNAHG